MKKILWVVLCLPVWVNAASDGTVPLKSKTAAPVEKKSPTAKPTAGKGPAEPYVSSIGTYGSSKINEVTLKELLGKELDVWLQKGLADDPSALELEKKFVKKVKEKYGFAFADWSIIQYFQPDDLALHLTLDVVEPADVARRMPFLPEPKEELADPAGLIKQWVEYENTAMDLVEAGELEPEASQCAALHCPFGHKHAKLKKYEKTFLSGVKKHSSALLDVLKKDKRRENRAAAAFLLAYWVDAKKKVVEALLDRIRDPEAVVRNNALRVLGDIAEFHPDVPIPVAPVLPALEFPYVSDRSKALYVVFLLATNSSQVREEVLKGSVPVLISLMECKQPDHKELAHNVLRKISGKEFPNTDARAWTAWYKKLPQAREVSKK